MTPRSFIALAIITLLTTIGAVVSSFLMPSAAPVALLDEPAFPALRANPDAVAKVTIQTKDGSVILTRTSPETWIAPDHYAYPAATERVARLVRQLNDMRLVEAKTANEARYQRLEVEDISDQSNTRLIRLEDEQGGLIAEVLMGKRHFRLTGSQPTGTYIRMLGEPQSWLASGGFELDPEIQTWLDQLVVGIPGERVARIEVQPAEGEGYAASRQAVDTPLALDNLAEGETPNEQADLRQLEGAFAQVRLADVRPMAEMTSWPEEGYTVSLSTFDGLGINAELVLIDDLPWARFTATETALPEGEAVTDEVRQEIESLNNRANGWAYQINQSVYQRLTKPRNTWIKETDGTS